MCVLLNKTLNITVKEFPIIQSIEFKGIKTKKLVSILNDQISLKSRSSFNDFFLKYSLVNSIIVDGVVINSVFKKIK